MLKEESKVALTQIMFVEQNNNDVAGCRSSTLHAYIDNDYTDRVVTHSLLIISMKIEKSSVDYGNWCACGN